MIKIYTVLLCNLLKKTLFIEIQSTYFKVLNWIYNRQKYAMRMRENNARLNTLLNENDEKKLAITMKTKEVNV